MLEFIEHLRRERYYRLLWDDIRARIEADLDANPSLLRDDVARALMFVGQQLLEDSAVRQKLNGWWLEAVRQIVSRHGHRIAGLITEVVRSWDAEQVGRMIELEIGKDLQYIRINGTLVGGTVGLGLHAVLLGA